MDESRDSALSRLTTAEAASRLGISEVGVRKRVQRGQIPHERDETRRLWVYVEESEIAGQGTRDWDRTSRDGPATDSGDALMAQMQARIGSLERQLEAANERDRENRRIIAALTSRIPELPAASSEEPPGVPEMATEDRVEPTPSEPTEGPQEGAQRSWWRRVFGG